MKDFLRSGPAVRCAFKISLGFLTGKTEQDCRNIIEGYVARRKDRGLTRALMRQACGLPVDDESKSDNNLLGLADPFSAAPPAAGAMAPSLQDMEERESMSVTERVALERKQELLRDHLALVNHVLASGNDFINRGSVGRLTRQVWNSRSSDARQKIFEETLQLSMWKIVGKRGQMGCACIPIITTRRSLAAVADLNQVDVSETLGELFDVDRFHEYMSAPGRDANQHTLRSQQSVSYTHLTLPTKRIV